VTAIADPWAIAVDHKGNPWVTDLNGNVYKHDGASWNEEAVAGLDAVDVATTPANRSWIVDVYGFIKELPFPERIHLINAFHTARLPTSFASNPTKRFKATAEITYNANVAAPAAENTCAATTTNTLLHQWSADLLQKDG
jgi:hypothetical protein